MKKKRFAELMGAMGEVLEHAQGKRALRTTTVRNGKVVDLGMTTVRKTKKVARKK